ncbi:YhjD/YihY/BrkB family envelope integrity protein [Terrilactibacillus sp. S3-3]|nr:YhjD/YihY/BrkB family envelope integrity protein [Terrilactibacillus sp. S3-3]
MCVLFFFVVAISVHYFFLFAIIPYIGLTQEEVLPLISRYVPDEVTTLIKQNLGHVFYKHGTLLSFGVIATIWPASGAINVLIRILNHAYNVKETRSFIVTRFLAICFTVAMIFAITMTLVINVLAAGFEKKNFFTI